MSGCEYVTKANNVGIGPAPKGAETESLLGVKGGGNGQKL
jgi:hypothetical protein